MKKFFKLICLFFLLFAVNYSVFAGGFEPNLSGVRQLGMANTGVAVIQGSSNLYFNPGSLVWLDNKFNAQFSATAFWQNSVYYDEVSGITARTVDKIKYSATGYFAAKPVSWLAIGFGVYQPYGVNTRWEDHWKGRFVVQAFKLNVTNYQPTVSVKLSKRLSFGAGLVYSTVKTSFVKDIPISSVTGQVSNVQLEGSGQGFTGSFGLFYKASDKLSLGFTYKSGLKYKYTKTKLVTEVPENVASSYPSGNDFNSSISTPDVFSVGVAYKFSKRFLVSSDITFNQWAVFQDTRIDFDKNSDLLKDLYISRKWRNTRSYSLGIQYLRNCCLTFRAGVAYEESPVNLSYFSPDILEAGKVTFNAGIGYDFNDHWSVDAAAVLVEGTQVEGNYHPIDYKGFYKNRSIGGMFGVSYVF